MLASFMWPLSSILSSRAPSPWASCSFLLTYDPMGAKISKSYVSYKSQPKVFKLFLNFLRTGRHKTTFGIFEILNIGIFVNFIRFVNMGPNESENFKNAASPTNSRQTFWNLSWNFPPNGPHKNMFRIFEIWSFWFLTNLFLEKANSPL